MEGADAASAPVLVPAARVNGWPLSAASGTMGPWMSPNGCSTPTPPSAGRSCATCSTNRPTRVAAERARVPREGWGRDLLALQDERGYWGGDEYGEDGDRRGTHWTLFNLLRLGAPADDPAVRSAIERVRDGVVWKYHDALPYFHGEVEECVQRGRARTRVVLRRARRRQRPHRGAAARGAARRRRVELRSRRGLGALVVRLHHLRARGTARLPARRGRPATGHRRGPAPRRGVPARAEPLPSAVHRRGREGALPQLRVPALLDLRRAACARLLPRRGRQPRPAARRSRSTWCARSDATTGAGRPAGRGAARCSSRSTHPRANPAGGTRSARSGWCAGSRATRRRPAPRRRARRAGPRARPSRSRTRHRTGRRRSRPGRLNSCGVPRSAHSA